MRPEKTSLLPVLALILCVCGPSRRASDSASLISGDRIKAHTKWLANDALEGRGVAGRAEVLTTEYIATQFTLAGAKAAGDDGTYFQRVPLVGVQSLPETRLGWRRGDRAQSLRYLDDFVSVNHRQQPLVEFDAETVYVGHGIVAPEFGWDDYKQADVRGKIVILFTNEPPSDDPGFFGGKALTYYGRWTFKYEQALRKGALGCIIIHTDPTAGYPWQVVRNSWSGREPFVKLQPGEPALAAAGWVTSTVGQELLSETGKTLDELLAMSESRDFQAIPLTLRLRGRIPSQVTPISTRNVVAAVEGSDPVRKDEAVIYTAHWDHLGIGMEVNGDAIYNGAVDNATGVALLLELASAFGELSPRPARSIVFASLPSRLSWASTT